MKTDDAGAVVPVLNIVGQVQNAIQKPFGKRHVGIEKQKPIARDSGGSLH